MSYTRNVYVITCRPTKMWFCFKCWYIVYLFVFCIGPICWGPQGRWAIAHWVNPRKIKLLLILWSTIIFANESNTFMSRTQLSVAPVPWNFAQAISKTIVVYSEYRWSRPSTISARVISDGRWSSRPVISPGVRWSRPVTSPGRPPTGLTTLPLYPNTLTAGCREISPGDLARLSHPVISDA